MTGRIWRGVLIALLALDGAVVGVFGLMFTPLYAGSIPAPLGAVVSMLTLPWLVRAAGELDPRAWVAGGPVLAWLVAVLVLGFVGPGGDIMMLPTWQSLLLLVGGLGTGLWALRSVLIDEGAYGMSAPQERAKEPTSR